MRIKCIRQQFRTRPDLYLAVLFLLIIILVISYFLKQFGLRFKKLFSKYRHFLESILLLNCLWEIILIFWINNRVNTYGKWIQLPVKSKYIIWRICLSIEQRVLLLKGKRVEVNYSWYWCSAYFKHGMWCLFVVILFLPFLWHR